LAPKPAVRAGGRGVRAPLVAALLIGRYSALQVLDICGAFLPPQFGVAKGLFSFGGWMLIASVTNMIAESLDRGDARHLVSARAL
jgi:hypothetical protein